MEIVVYIESYQGKISKASLEALSAAEKLEGSISAVLICAENREVLEKELGMYNVNKIFTGTGNQFKDYNSDLFAHTVSKIAGDIYIFGATTWGRELAPKLSIKNDFPFIGMVRNVVNSTTIEKNLHGNKIIATFKIKGPCVMTTQPGMFDFPEKVENTPTISSIEITETFQKVMLKEVLPSDSGKVELTEADIVLGGGRGLKSSENFMLLENFAKAFNAGVGASRAAVDEGWRPHSDQIGQTGKVINPKLYLAIGISGAIQHIAGIMGSGIIVAINKDAEAPIFKIADYGIVADLFEVVEKLQKSIEEAKKA